MNKPAQCHVVTVRFDNAGQKADAQLADEEAQAFVQLLKRLTGSDVRGCAVDDAESNRMMDAICKVQDALRRAGYTPH